jgi:hypothetical protein
MLLIMLGLSCNSLGKYLHETNKKIVVMSVMTVECRHGGLWIKGKHLCWCITKSLINCAIVTPCEVI